ncbi:4'-phosphopantetheinyl transferase family protein [Pedobacter mucosus]|uniref:4'-phosphopantetheinyl transferase family protein n=1 Tax=Pedobacter mucosus TaxID=2895286 RepID=UPI001EE4A2D6|nr:4'-phosphopantetheinyl transferase superfamily protein [Pedobacter mucosus]UKT62832.1 4'-phosphopantetheinyl transferase superfamily protein [Pedobacter mucosus]
MLGNDLIDLEEAALKSNWKRKGFLEKLFTAEEQQEVLIAINPLVKVWLLWSMKEAAYKIVNRINNERFFSPLKFSCNLSSLNEGTVIYEGQKFHTKSRIERNFIHTIALKNPHYFNIITTKFLPYHVEYVNQFNIQSTKYFLAKDDFGIPKLTDKDTQLEHISSISHHGKFLALVHI